MDFIQQHFVTMGSILYVLVSLYFLVVLDYENQELKRYNAFIHRRFKDVYEENLRLEAQNSHLRLNNPYTKK